MTQELQARLYDVLRLVVGSDIAQPEEREFAFATAVELTKQYPSFTEDDVVVVGSLASAICAMRTKEGKCFTFGDGKRGYSFHDGLYYRAEQRGWRPVMRWLEDESNATDWREVQSGQTEVAQINVEGPFDRETAARLGDEFGIEFTCANDRFRRNSGRWQVYWCHWATCSPNHDIELTPVHNLAWAKWAMKQGVELDFGDYRYRWNGTAFEAQSGRRGWTGTSLNSDGWDPGSEDWKVAK